MFLTQGHLPQADLTKDLVKGNSESNTSFMNILSNSLANGIPLEILQAGIGLEGELDLLDEGEVPVHLFPYPLPVNRESVLFKEENTFEEDSPLDQKVEVDQALPVSILKDIPEKLESLSKQILQVLNQIISGEKVSIQDAKLLSLLKEYVKIKKLGDRLHIPLQPVKLAEVDLTAEAKELFQRLISSFERRSKLTESGRYMNESVVNDKTLTEWLQNILKDMNINPEDQQNTQLNHRQGTDNLSMPMTKTEQFIIHVQRQDQDLSTTFERQILQKFEQAIRTTQFLRANNGPNQLIFHLKPENLGEMLVRLVEIDGEMTAKIIVTSEASRRALQANIHQLKNMFLPHQLIIEKQDEVVLQQTKEQTDSTKEDQREEEQLFKEEEKNQSKQKEEKESISFKDLLVGKV